MSEGRDRPQADTKEEPENKKSRVETGRRGGQKWNPKTSKNPKKNPKDAEEQKRKIEANKAVTQAMARKDVDACATALKTAIDQNIHVPTSTLAGVLRQFELAHRSVEGIQLYEDSIDPYLTARMKRIAEQKSRESNSRDLATSLGGGDDGGLDEKVSTVLLRLQCHSGQSKELLMARLERCAKVLHDMGTLRRRLFSEPLKYFAVAATGKQLSVFEASNCCLAIAQAANRYNMELWDEDILQVFTAIEVDLQRHFASHDLEKNSVNEFDLISGQIHEDLMLGTLTRYHPIVGSLLARKLHSVLTLLRSGGQISAGLSSEGFSLDAREDTNCSQCGAEMSKFDFNDRDRSMLLKDIDERLVVPSIYRYVTTGSHRVGKAQKNADQADYKTALAALKDEDMKSFTSFKASIERACSLPLPKEFVEVAIIDGANVGYYGVSGWYSNAKRESLRSKGVDPTTVPAYELEHSHRKGKAMDVPLNFAAINAAAVEVMKRNWLPIIVLHERHLNGTMTPRNKSFFDDWAAQSTLRVRPMVVASPASMNDDFAWLYASVANHCKVITNDLMRDHHYGTLSRRNFLRWREQYRVPFKCKWPNTTGGIPLDAMRLTLANPPKFAVWIQAAIEATGTTTTSSSGSRSVAPPSMWDWHIPYYRNLEIFDQSTNTVLTEEEQDAAAAEQETIMWLCTRAK